MTRRGWHMAVFGLLDGAALLLFVLGDSDGATPVVAAILLLAGALVALTTPSRQSK